MCIQLSLNPTSRHSTQTGFNTALKPPSIDPHAAWFAKHFFKGNYNSSMPVPPIVVRGGAGNGNSSGGGRHKQQPSAGDGAAIGTGNTSPDGMDSPPNSDPEHASERLQRQQGTQMVRWWQNQAQTFGDIDLVIPSASGPAAGPVASADGSHGRCAHGETFNF